MTGEEFARHLDLLVASLAKLSADRKTVVDQGCSQAIIDERDRCAAGLSLGAVIDFLNCVPEWRAADLDFALRRLLIAITNINDGRTEEWLANQAPNRSRLPLEVLTGRGRCAGVMDALRGAGWGRQSAAEFVVTNLPDGAFGRLALSAHATPWKVVAEWRSSAKREAKPGDGLDPLRAEFQHQLALGAAIDRPIEDVSRAALAAVANSLR